MECIGIAAVTKVVTTRSSPSIGWDHGDHHHLSKDGRVFKSVNVELALSIDTPVGYSRNLVLAIGLRMLLDLLRWELFTGAIVFVAAALSWIASTIYYCAIN